ncbi:MAG: hypothetical protein COA83_03530 [Methylophaga sp.]|nr:MAG: hypothetical protein COA83_03530 [Methylophaga sp.]
MLKKVSLALLALFVISAGAFYFINSTDNYDGSNYSATVPDTFTVGSTLDFTLPDQFGTAHSLKPDTKTLIFTFAKDSAHIMKDFLMDKEDGYLSQKSAYYIADISTAPVLIRNAFIIPSLQKSPYPVLLVYEEETATKFRYDAKKEAIKVVTLENMKVTNVQFVATLAEFEAALN